MFWLCYKSPQGVRIVLQPGYSLIHARLRAHMAGLDPGEFKQGHQLDAKMVKRIPKNMIGRSLSVAQATKVIRLLDRKRA